jgi:short chain dehydrogenase
MRQNSYGRIVVTTSNAGLYGNFGQANYSAAKTAVIGFASTLELEGAKYNIKANVIAPVAASRLTEDVMPPAALERLKPELVSPVVAYLCSEECQVSGNIFTAGGGYVGRAAIVEGKGAVFSSPTIEDVRDNFAKITDMSGAEEFTNAFDEVQKRLMQATGA